MSQITIVAVEEQRAAEAVRAPNPTPPGHVAPSFPGACAPARGPGSGRARASPVRPHPSPRSPA